MLKKIRIKNFAIIEDIEILFNSNFTALTGATGAGKSLVIDSLKLIFGKRADTDFIRHGQDEAVVKALFVSLNKQVKKYLTNLSLSTDKLIIERWISKKDRNKVLINNRLSTLKELQELGLLIGDIHEQHETTKLLDPATALSMVDQLGKTKDNKNEYVILRYNYLQALNKYEKALLATKQTEEKLEENKFKYNELLKANLKSNEINELEIQINVLSHQKEIIESFNKAYQNIKYIDEQSLLYNSFSNLEKIKDFNPDYKNIYDRLLSSYYDVNDIKDELYNILDSFSESSLLELETLQERYYFLKDLINKYNKDIDELIEYKDILEEQILQHENYDEFIEKLKRDKENKYNIACQKAVELSKKRKIFAVSLEKEFVQILNRLDIPYVEFKVSFLKKELLEDGIDDVQFLISLNKGEPLKPFYKVASGGELTRSMLALKILYTKLESLSLIVFDEIDLGISGDAASKVSIELKELSKNVQVIAITHLPQVAAKATTHYNILKQVEEGRTTTLVENLDYDKRVYYLAYMLSGKSLTEGSLLHAKSLLGNKKSPKA